MWTLFLLTIAAQFLTVCLSQTIDEAASMSYLSKECNSKLVHIDSLGNFKKFMEHYHVMINCRKRPNKGMLNQDRGLQRCFDLKEDLLALEELINQQDNRVCQNDYIKKLVAYHMKYVVKPSSKADRVKEQEQIAIEQQPIVSTKTTFAARIFSLFAHQVVYTCKGKLLQRVKMVQAEKDCSAVLGSFLPVDIIKGATSSASSDSHQEQDKFIAFLNNFKRVEDFALTFTKTSKLEPYYNSIVTPEVIQKVNKLKELCRASAPHYRALFGPVATLSQLGYDVEESSVDSQDLDSGELILLKSWLVTAQLCQGILRTHISTPRDGEHLPDDKDKNDKLVEIKFGEVPEDVADGEGEGESTSNNLPDSLKFEDSIEEITQNIKEVVRKKSSLKRRLQWRALQWAKSFIARHVDIDRRHSEMASEFIRVLTRGDDEMDAPVAFNGRKKNQGLYNPARLVADDADTITTSVALFVHKQLGLIINSVVAICLTAVFIWFALYAIISSVRISRGRPDPNGNFKVEWRKLRDSQMNKLNNKIHRKSWKDKMVIYTPKNA